MADAARGVTASEPSPPHPFTFPVPGVEEARFYYYGLPSSPVLVARTGTTPWQPLVRTGPEAYRRLKELRPAENYPPLFAVAWRGGDLPPKLCALLDSLDVQWTSLDVVRIGLMGESAAPMIVWIGVVPGSLSGADGVVAVTKAQELLAQYNITDIFVEIRESVVLRHASPRHGSQLLARPSFAVVSDPTVELREPFTPTLGLPICGSRTSWIEGTGGFFVQINEQDVTKTLLVTARHVVLPMTHHPNTHYEHRNPGEPRHYVQLFGPAGFDQRIGSIQSVINKTANEVARLTRRATTEEYGEKERLASAAKLKVEERVLEKLRSFLQDVLVRFSSPENRILGHIRISPAIGIGVGKDEYTEDWAAIEIEPSKLDSSNFPGNAIDLGVRFERSEWNEQMYPNVKDPPSFTISHDRLLMLKGTIPHNELFQPHNLDSNEQPCTMVVKRGAATGLTVGRASGFESYVRYYEPFEELKGKISKEWSILPSNNIRFSDEGDSGCVVVDGQGRIGGILTGGANANEKADTDVSYVTPIEFILDRMKLHGLEPTLYPTFQPPETSEVPS